VTWGHVARREEMRSTWKILSAKPKGRNRLLASADGMMKCISEKYCLIIDGCELGNKSSCSVRKLQISLPVWQMSAAKGLCCVELRPY
jgi:hypothetical protein